MAIRDWFRRGGNAVGGREFEIETKSAGMSDLQQFLTFGARQSATTARSALDLYDSSTAVQIPVNLIADKFAELEPVLIIDDDKIVDHPLLDFIRKPSPDYTKELLFKSAAVYYLVCGEHFDIYVGNTSQPPTQHYPIDPSLLSYAEENGFVAVWQVSGKVLTGEYVRQEEKGNHVFVTDDSLTQIGQIRDFSTKDANLIRGRSRLVAASNAARLQLLGAEHNLSILEKGGRMSMIFHFDQELDDLEFEELKTRVRNQYGGSSNAGEIGVTAGGKLDIKNVGMTPVDMDWSKGQEISEGVLANMYHVPLPLISMAAATFNNYTQATLSLYDDAVIPLSSIVFGGWSRDLFPRFKVDPRAKLTFDPDRVTALVMRRNEEVKLRSELQIESDNELRGIIGREAYEGGDVIYKPATMIPVGTDIDTDEDDTDLIDD